jgi:hypothetical protein
MSTDGQKGCARHLPRAAYALRIKSLCTAP